jgi:hypothetical protein
MACPSPIPRPTPFGAITSGVRSHGRESGVRQNDRVSEYAGWCTDPPDSRWASKSREARHRPAAGTEGGGSCDYAA